MEPTIIVRFPKTMISEVADNPNKVDEHLGMIRRMYEVGLFDDKIQRFMYELAYEAEKHLSTTHTSIPNLLAYIYSELKIIRSMIQNVEQEIESGGYFETDDVYETAQYHKLICPRTETLAELRGQKKMLQAILNKIYEGKDNVS